MLKIKKTTLPNGMRVLTIPMQSTEAVTVMVHIRAGSRYETKRINGIAHFLEHMFFKGGKRYPTPRAVSETVDGIGGEFNAFTDDEFVGYYVRVAKNKVETAFDVLSDMLLNAHFDKDALNRERGVILEEMNMKNDTPIRGIWDDFESLLFGDHPLGWTTLGLPEVIKRLQSKDFSDYRQRLYTPKNIVLMVVGGIAQKDANRLAKKYFPYEKGGKKNQPVPYSFKKHHKKLKVIYKKSDQAHLVLGVPSFHGKHPDRYVLAVLSVILGGGMSSRLFTKIREENGLAYSVFSTRVIFTDTGFIAAKASVDVSRIDLAISLVLDELRRISSEPVPNKELKKAKEYIVGHNALSLEDSDSIAMRYGLQELLYDEIETFADLKKHIKAVTAEDIQRVAKTLFRDDRLALTVIGPYRDDKKIKKVFKL
ncbi:MAG: pitrilysin family protein [Patescibacteria group bacterium]|nr:pitrilysin family protein [Patescibacteria group bacterium]